MEDCGPQFGVEELGGSRVHFQLRQDSRLALDLGNRFTRPIGAHLSVKTFSVGIRGNFDFRNVLSGRALHGMKKQLFSDPGADVFGRHPQVIEDSLILMND